MDRVKMDEPVAEPAAPREWWDDIEPRVVALAREICAEWGNNPDAVADRSRQPPIVVETPIGAVHVAGIPPGYCPLWACWAEMARLVLREADRMAAPAGPLVDDIPEAAELPPPSLYPGGPLIIGDASASYTVAASAAETVLAGALVGPSKPTKARKRKAAKP